MTTRPNPRHLILDLLLAADGRPLSARAAVTAAELFGISDNHARVALVRLAADGLIRAAGRGRYLLSPRAHELADDVATWRSVEQRVRDWQGGYLAAYCGALGRSDRKALRRRRRALDMLGFREFERGLYLRPDNLHGDLAAVRARLLRLGLERDARVFAAAGFDPVAENRIRRLWNGRALNAQYRRLHGRLQAWIAGSGRLPPEQAARQAFLIGGDAIRHVVYDPLLPEPFVDVAARRAFVEAVREFDRVGRCIWTRLFEQRGLDSVVGTDSHAGQDNA